MNWWRKLLDFVFDREFMNLTVNSWNFLIFGIRSFVSLFFALSSYSCLDFCTRTHVIFVFVKKHFFKRSYSKFAAFCDFHWIWFWLCLFNEVTFTTASLMYLVGECFGCRSSVDWMIFVMWFLWLRCSIPLYNGHCINSHTNTLWILCFFTVSNLQFANPVWI